MNHVAEVNVSTRLFLGFKERYGIRTLVYEKGAAGRKIGRDCITFMPCDNALTIIN